VQVTVFFVRLHNGGKSLRVKASSYQKQVEEYMCMAQEPVFAATLATFHMNITEDYIIQYLVILTIPR